MALAVDWRWWPGHCWRACCCSVRSSASYELTDVLAAGESDPQSCIVKSVVFFFWCWYCSALSPNRHSFLPFLAPHAMARHTAYGLSALCDPHGQGRVFSAGAFSTQRYPTPDPVVLPVSISRP